MCWSKHRAWSCSPSWPDSCHVTWSPGRSAGDHVPKHRSGMPLQKLASSVPLILLILKNLSLVWHRSLREVLSTDAMHYKEYMSTMMGLTPITLSWRKFSLFCPFVIVSCFLPLKARCVYVALYFEVFYTNFVLNIFTFFSYIWNGKEWDGGCCPSEFLPHCDWS